MGQIIGGAAKPKRCNFNKLSQLGTPAAGVHILVSRDNSMTSTGQGNFTHYIVGNGSNAATDLELHEITKDWSYDIDFVINGEKVTDSFFYSAGGSLTIGSTAKWYQPAYRKHIVIPAEEGDVFTITPTSTGASDALYGWLTSEYAPPQNTTTLIPYVSGTTRNSTAVGTEVQIVAPAGTAYLCLVTIDGGGNTITFDIEINKNSGIVKRVTTLENYEVENACIREGIGYQKSVTIPDFANGYISTTGAIGSSTSVMYSTKPIKIYGDMLAVSVDYDALRGIVDGAGDVSFNVHCYDSSNTSLGRTSQGYQYIKEYTPQYQYLTGTKYVRFTFAIKASGTTTDMTISDYLDAINAAKDTIFTIKEVQRGEVDVVRNIPYELYTQVLDGKMNIYTHYGLIAASSASTSGQSYELYNGYLFQLIPNGTIKLYTLEDGEAVYSTDLTYSSSTHANSAQFYPSSVNSGFPYLYVADKNVVEVLTITTSSVTISQTITLSLTGPTSSYPAWASAGDDGYLWANWADTANNRLYFFKLNLPNVSNGDVTLTDSDIVDSWYLDNYEHNDYVSQGMKVRHGKLYQVYGGTYGSRGIWVYDTKTHNMIADIKLDDYMSLEFEDVVFKDDSLLLFIISNAYFYELVF